VFSRRPHSGGPPGARLKRVRRSWTVLVILGSASILVAIPLSHVTPQSAAVCPRDGVCDVSIVTPYANLASVLTLAGIALILGVAVVAALTLVGRFRHHSAIATDVHIPPNLGV
jgi:hypothetical protein